MNDGAPKRKPGRPPSTEARARALQAAREILSTDGLNALTIEAVASRSGTGKPTLYRHWANALELGMDALMQDVAPALPPDLEASPKAAIIRQLDRLIESFSPPKGAQIIQALALCDGGNEMAQRFRQHLLYEGRDATRAMLLGFIEKGQLKQPQDMDVFLDALFAPVFYRLLAGDDPLNKALPAQLVDAAFAALEPDATEEGQDT